MGSSKGNFDDLARASSAGTASGDGGGGGRGRGDAAPPSPPPLPLAPPPASPSSDPSTLAASPPPLQPPGPPPRAAAADEDMLSSSVLLCLGWRFRDEVPDDEEEDPEEEGDYLLEEEEPEEEDDYLLEEEEPKEQDDGYWNWDQEEAEYNWGALEEGEMEDDGDSREEERDDQDWGENLRGSSDSEFFSVLFMSNRRNVPDDIIRNGFDPLNKHEYFSRHKFWRQLLGLYKSYHRPPMDHRVVNGGFQRPHDYQRALGLQEQISKLILESSDNNIIQEKIEILSKQYGLFRRTRIDGSCFYRAFLFSYLENLGQMQDRQAEVIRVMECVEISIRRFYQFEWEEAYFLNPEKYFLSVVSEFYSLVNSVANGLTSDKLYDRSLEEMSSGRIISFLRLLTEIEIRTQYIYKPYIPERMSAVQFCWKEVRGLYAEAGAVQMRALTYALGIPLRVEIVDTKKWTDEAVRVKRLDFFHQSDLGKGRIHMERSYYTSRTTHKPVERGSGDDLLSSDGAPLLALLSRNDQCDILYPK